MKKVLKQFTAMALAFIMLLSTAPLTGFVGFTNLEANAADNGYKVGNIIEFGSYPQTEVKDEVTLSALNSKSLSWKSYGYYSGNGSYGSMTASDYMQYADVSYLGEE